MTCLALIAVLLSANGSDQGSRPRLPDPAKMHVVVRRGQADLAKLSPELLALYRQFTLAERERRVTYSASQLMARFGIAPGEPNPWIRIAVRGGGDLSSAGFVRRGAGQGAMHGEAQVLSLAKIVAVPDCQAVSALRPALLPGEPPDPTHRIRRPTIARGEEGKPGSFDHQGLTGKGVVIGIIDTGIDWKHKDFVRPDGTSRILMLYDMWDDTWTESNGAAGSKPPMDFKGKPLGTVYTNAQINAALAGKGEVNSRDIIGHGTACAGVAAGTSDLYPGIAPGADLIVVKAFRDSGNVFVDYHLAVKWVLEEADALGKPCVVNLSLGGHDSAHDGSADEETFLDGLVGPGKPGRAICVAAGNEGRDSFHAGGVFGPLRKGQNDIESAPVELFVSERTELTAFFDSRDEWGLAIVGLDGFLVNGSDPLCLSLSYTGTARQLKGALNDMRVPDAEYKGGLWKSSAPAGAPKDFNDYFSKGEYVSVSRVGTTDRVQISLWPGKYELYGFGATETVSSGRFDVYLPFTRDGSFGKGMEPAFLIGSPGNAANVITVGAYDFRDKWLNKDGEETKNNMTLGSISNFSSAGYRRDGRIKPDICAPGRYAISALSEGCRMSRGADGAPASLKISKDGTHIAWAGTSAASPYAAGVVALMLEANPKLDAARIADILRSTRAEDMGTGRTPNAAWGHGKLDPAKAIAEAKKS